MPVPGEAILPGYPLPAEQDPGPRGLISPAGPSRREGGTRAMAMAVPK